MWCVMDKRPGAGTRSEILAGALVWIDVSDREGIARMMVADFSDRMIEPLTRRESEIVALMCTGVNNEGISSRLGITYRTVEKHCTNIFIKAGFHGRGTGKRARLAVAVFFESGELETALVAQSFSWPSRFEGDQISASKSGVDTKSPDGLYGAPPVILPGRCSGPPLNPCHVANGAAGLRIGTVEE